MKTNYEIPKGVDNPVEFKGLKGIYIFLFAGAVIGSFLITVILYLSGIEQITAVLAGALLMGGSCLAVAKLNGKYGQSGIIKLMTQLARPRFIVRRKSARLLLNSNEKKAK